MRRAIVLLLTALAGCSGHDPGNPTPPSAAEPPTPPPSTPPPPPPTASAPAVGTPRAVWRGSQFGCVLREGGRVACWGRNDEGQLGQDHREAVEGAVHVVDLEDAIAIATTTTTACALRASGVVTCWGEGRSGTLGIPRVTSGKVDVPGLSGMRHLDAGGGRFYAWGDDGVVYAWGLPSSRLDEEERGGVRRTRIHDLVRVEGGGRMLYTLGPDGAATRWPWGAEASPMRDAFEIASGSTGVCIQNREGAVHCSLELGGGPVERDADVLRGAEELRFGLGGTVVGLREGTLVAFGYDANATTRYADADDLVTLGRGDGLSAITRDGRVLVWQQPTVGGAFPTTEITLPAPDAVATEPPLPDGPMPAYCRVEVERIAAPPPLPRARALAVSLGAERDDDAGSLEPADLCLSMGVPLGAHDCPADGPWVAKAGVSETVSFVVPLADDRAQVLFHVAEDWAGTEESNTLERWTLRSARPLTVAMLRSRGEPDEDEELGTTVSEVERSEVVVLETPEGDFVEVRAIASTSRLRRAHASLTRLPRAELASGRVALWACNGHGTYPIPSAPSHAYDPRLLDEPIEASPEAPPAEATQAEPPPAEATQAEPTQAEPTQAEPTQAEPTQAEPRQAVAAPTAAEIAAARQACEEGFSALATDSALARRRLDEGIAVLERASDPTARRSLGACLYSRGRAARIDGDLAAARDLWTRSLAARPNATVQAALDSLAEGASD